MPRSPLALMVVICLFASVPSANSRLPSSVSSADVGAVVGQIVEPSGAPAANVVVTVLSPQLKGSRTFSVIAPTLRTTTDADGLYRLEAVPAGPVYVLAIPHNALRTEDGQHNPTGMSRTFYPSAAKVDAATTVQVPKNGATSANITLRATPLYSLSGIVWTQAGTPAGNAFVEIAHGDGLFGVDTRGFTVGANGTFLLPAVEPGTYFLQFHQSAWPPSPGEIPSVSGATVTITDRDVRDIRVAPIHMVAISGRVQVDAAGKPPKPAAIVIGASPVDGEGSPGPQHPDRLADDFSFSFKTWPSHGAIHVLPEGDWIIKSIRVGGEVVANAFEFAPNADVSGVDVEIARRPGGDLD